MTPSIINAIALCLLSIVAVVAIGLSTGATIKGIWKLLTEGAVREFLSPEGHVCAFLGALFGIFMLVLIYTPDIIGYLARMINPTSFAPPKEPPVVIIWLVFSYFVINIVLVGLLYRRK